MPVPVKRPLPKGRWLCAAAVVTGLGAVSLGVAPAAAAPAAPTGSTPSGNVIVLLKNQNANTPITKGSRGGRVLANHDSQQPVLRKARAVGASQLHSFGLINGFSAHVTAAQAANLAADPTVAAVVPDLPISRAPQLAAERAVAAPGIPKPRPKSGICPTDPSKPLLEPEALQVTHTAYQDTTRPQAQNLSTGKGVKVAFLADGVDINNPDFIRADGSHVFVDYQDFSGEGPNAVSPAAEAFGDASAIAAQGRQTYDLANYVNPAHPLPAGCTIQIRGMAPDAGLIGLKVFGNANTAPTSRFIQAIEYAVTDGADVMNESFSANPFPDTSDDPITLADNAAIAAGVTVTASSGDAGTTGTIGSPASSPAGIISVAATTTFRSYLQEDAQSSREFSNGTWISNNSSGLSSGGVTQAGGVPDLAAPGDLGWALCTPNTDLYTGCTDNKGNPSSIQVFGGTSQSAPLTAGAAALVISAYEATHGGHKPAPALVKRLLTSTATDLGHPAYEQGAGLLNSLAAVKAAHSWRDANATPARSGNALVVNQTQLRLSGYPGEMARANVRVTNAGRSVQLVRASTRSFEDVVSGSRGTATLNTATAPTYLDQLGRPRSYVAQTFTVGAVNRLDVSAAAPTNSSFRVFLIDPTGAFTAYSIPQGTTNYAHVDVRFPKAGTWTMYVAVPNSSGFNGTFAYTVVQTDFSTHGTVSPRYRVLRPGQTGTFTVRAPLPTAPGDLSASVQFHAAGGVTASVPMTLRSLVPPRDTQFVGTITGGNGRSDAPAQTNIYSLVVPGGKRDLSIGVRFGDPNATYYGFLTAPDGQVYSFQENAADPAALQIYRRNPTAGRWTFSLETTNPVSGLELSSPFIATVAYNTVDIRAAALPDSASVKLKAGVPVTVPVRVHNTGVAPITYYADARLRTVGSLPLRELTGNATTPLPVPAGVYPTWLVPTEASRATFTATADQPVNLDMFFQSGEPERYAAANGNSATVIVNAAQVSPGLWAADVGQSGPFSGPAPVGMVTVSAAATGRLFDPAVTAPGGDPWQLGLGTNAATAADVAVVAKRVGVNKVHLDSSTTTNRTPAATAPMAAPLTLRPGQSGTLNVTITPTGRAGTVVRGDLFIDSFDTNLLEGDEISALPYTYRIR